CPKKVGDGSWGNIVSELVRMTFEYGLTRDVSENSWLSDQRASWFASRGLGCSRFSRRHPHYPLEADPTPAYIGSWSSAGIRPRAKEHAGSAGSGSTTPR